MMFLEYFACGIGLVYVYLLKQLSLYIRHERSVNINFDLYGQSGIVIEFIAVLTCVV